MKLLLSLLLVSPFAWGQTIQNSSFELPQDTNRHLPQGWEVGHKAGYTIALDSTLAKSGRRSLLISSASDTASGPHGFSQTCIVQLKEPTLVHLRGYVKTDNPVGVGVWWNAWHDSQHRGFASLDQQVVLRQTEEWQALDLVLPTPTDVTKYNLGAYLRGRGRVWFDDLRLETVTAKAGPPSAPVKAYLQNVMTLVKKHALVADSISWTQAQAELMSFARGMQTKTETYPLIGYLLGLMRHYGDNHSFFIPPQIATSLQADQPGEPGSQGPLPQTRYLGDGVGYVAVPGFMAMNRKREMVFARLIQNLIRQLDSSQRISRWVVDVRGNTGGNIIAMTAGLMPLYGKQVPAYTKKMAKRFYKGDPIVERPYQLRQVADRVAVLLDEQTASSGEGIALSFIGLPNVRSFGQHSAGYTTANDSHKLSNGVLLVIAELVNEDRRGKPYRHGIPPDDEVKGMPTPSSDPTLEAAKSWLVNK